MIVLWLPVYHPESGMFHWQGALYMSLSCQQMTPSTCAEAMGCWPGCTCLWCEVHRLPACLHRALAGNCRGSWPACILYGNHTSAEAAGAALQDLKEAMDHKDSFLSVMSHELRTPINGIMGELGLHAKGV